jgi:hypothetical protein
MTMLAHSITRHWTLCAYPRPRQRRQDNAAKIAALTTAASLS